MSVCYFRSGVFNYKSTGPTDQSFSDLRVQTGGFVYYTVYVPFLFSVELCHADKQGPFFSLHIEGCLH